eukprot:scaffold15479_cov65-Cyclotella_meneghiniana.AAC.3
MGQYVLSCRDDMATCHQNMTCLRGRENRDPILEMSRQGHMQLSHRPSAAQASVLARRRPTRSEASIPSDL